MTHVKINTTPKAPSKAKPSPAAVKIAALLSPMPRHVTPARYRETGSAMTRYLHAAIFGMFPVVASASPLTDAVDSLSESQLLMGMVICIAALFFLFSGAENKKPVARKSQIINPLGESASHGDTRGH